MLFARKNYEETELIINGLKITLVSEAKFLGVLFDEKLTWSSHIKIISNKANQATNLIKAFAGIKWGSHPHYLIQIYKGYVRAIPDWGHICYGNANKKLLNKIEVGQNRALKICLGLLNSTPNISTLKVSNCAPLESRRMMLTDNYLLKTHTQLKHQLQPKLRLLEEILKKKKIKGSRIMLYTRSRNEIVKKQTIGMHEQELPTCFSITLEAQWHNCKVDLELGKKIKTKDKIEGRNCTLVTELEKTYPQAVEIYTDASKSEQPMARVRATVYDRSTRDVQNWNLNPKSSTLEAELFAIKKALWLAWEKRYKRIVILSDSKESLQRFQNKKRRVSEILTVLEIKQKTYLMTRQRVQVNFIRIPGHSGLPGNCIADELSRCRSAAENVSELKPHYTNFIETLKSEYFNSYHTLTRKTLKNHNKYLSVTPLITVKNELTHIKNMNRREAVIYLRLCTGSLSDYMYLKKIKVMDTEECICGCPMATVEHLLFYCNQYSVTRIGLMDSLSAKNLPNSLNQILSSRCDTVIKELINFFVETQLPI